MNTSRSMLLAGLAVLAALVFWILRGDSTSVEGDGSPVGNPGAATSADGAGNRGASLAELGAETDVLREETEASSAGGVEDETEAETPRILMSGRCVAAESGEPLAGCEVTLHGWATNSNDMAMRPDFEWQDPAPILTGEDGRFDLDFPDVAPWQYAITIRKEGRVDRRGRWSTDLTAETPRHFGDIAMVAGVLVSGRVVDEEGTAIAGATIHVDGVSGVDLDRPTRSAGANASTDGAGRFELTTALPAGTFPLDARVDGYLYVGEEVLEVPEGVETVEVELVVRAMPSIAGRVQLVDGSPVAGAQVRVEDHQSGWTASERTAEDGGFRIYATNLVRKPFQLSVAGPGIERSISDEAYEWGDDLIVLVARPTLALELTVIEAGVGTPVTEYAVACHPEDARSSSSRGNRLGGEHPEGKLLISGVAEGKNLLTVVPWDPALRVAGPVEFEVDQSGPVPMTVEVERMESLQVQVVRPNGNGVSGAQVDVIDRPLTDPRQIALEPRTGRVQIYGSGQVDYPNVLVRAESDAEGLTSLYWPKSLVEGGLRVEVAGRVTIHPLVRPLDQDSPILITIGGLGRVQGTLLHPLVGTDRIRLAYREDSEFAFMDEALEIDSEGRFDAKLPAGSYILFLSQFRTYRIRGGTTSTWASVEPELVRFVIVDEQVTELEVDASALVFGKMSGSITLDGEPYARAPVILYLKPPVAKPRSEGLHGVVYTDAAGRYSADELPPGTWTVALGSLANVEEGVVLRHPNRVELAPGEEVKKDFDFRQVAMEITVLHPDTGAPLPEVDFFVDTGDYGVLKTDRNGRIRLDPAPLVEFTLSGSFEDGRLRVGPLQVDPKQALTEIELPARRP